MVLAIAGCASPAPQPTVSSSSQSPISTPGPTSTAISTAEPPGTEQPTAVVPATETPSVAPSGTGSIIQPFASGFSSLTFATNAGDRSGDLYVVAQAGQIYKLAPGESAPGTPWLDISGRISSGGERGLLGLAFHPDYASNGRFFVDYTNVDGNSIISEFSRAADGRADVASERVLMEVEQPYANHNGGMLAFGPDGYLYIGFGDGGSEGDPQGNGQNLTTELGKILRIDVDSGDPYEIPPDNPFQQIQTSTDDLSAIWDWGLRNPWRFSFDRLSGALFIGDVGQGQTEEIDVEPPGQGGRNYGWNTMEGDHCYNASSCNETGLTLPVATYSHADGCAVTGGCVYRGTLWPAMAGRYFYGDYCSGRVWSFDADQAIAGQPVTPQLFGQTSLSITTFGQDEAGELYIGDTSGGIYSLTPP